MIPIDAHGAVSILNGDFDKRNPPGRRLSRSIGPTQIGNWNGHDRKLSGRIDELLSAGPAR